jgi:signal transduction histidine kinase
LRANAEEKHILLVNETDKDIQIHADVNIFSTVLRNLISNAIKYTSSDGFIRVRSEETETAIQIEVIDNGIGIPQENMDKLFNLEKTFSTKGTSEEEGSGLGLILCKEFTEKNGGQIWADSVQGQGSRFFFTVPKKN